MNTPRVPVPTPLAVGVLADPPPGVVVPRFDRAAATAGVLHLGVGGFHRSHQAVHFQRLLEAGHLAWGIHGVGVLPSDAALRDALEPQGWLYALSLRDRGVTEHEVIASLLEHTLAPDDPERVCQALAAPTTAVVTLTITEGGYAVDKATGAFTPTPALTADAEPGAVPSTAFGFLLEGLRRRRAAGLPSFTVLSCDNLQHNGALARTALVGLAAMADARSGDDLAAWVAEHTAFPSSMVDRITPVTTDADRAALREATGLEDRWPVVAEPYLQWVLEDRFSAARPPLEEAGVQMVDDVAPYELMKLRLLNASHQVMSYPGVLVGRRTVHEVCTDPVFVGVLRRWMDGEARPTLAPVPGVDLDAYRDSLLSRFANPAVGDTLARNCAQGSERIATFVVPVVREALELGLDVSVGAVAVAAWARCARGVDERGARIEVVDDRLPEVQSLLERSPGDPLAVLELHSVFGELGRDERFRQAVAAADAELDRGVMSALGRLADGWGAPLG